MVLTRRGEPSGARRVVLAARALPLLRQPRGLRLRSAAPRAGKELRAVDDGGMKVRVETTVRVHLRMTDVVSVGGGLAADRAGAWHRRWSPSGEVNSNVTVATIVRQFDGAALLRALEAATARLEAGAGEGHALPAHSAPARDTRPDLAPPPRAAAEDRTGAPP